MSRNPSNWDPSWIDDWRDVQSELEEQLEKEAPLDPEQAVEYYRHGFETAKTHPGRIWSDIEVELYRDYMEGAPQPGEWEERETDWEGARAWAHRGWAAGVRSVQEA